MREILFRAKWVDDFGNDSNFVYGYYVKLHEGKKKERHFIYTGYAEADFFGTDDETWFPDKLKVNPDTVGQYTGICDSNGKQIFEGDIITFPYRNRKETGVVSYVNGRFYVKNKVELRNAELHNVALFLEIYVIGNIHDNPELVE